MENKKSTEQLKSLLKCKDSLNEMLKKEEFGKRISDIGTTVMKKAPAEFNDKGVQIMLEITGLMSVSNIDTIKRGIVIIDREIASYDEALKTN